MKAVLLPNVTTFPSESMRRYASELYTALGAVPNSHWEIEQIVCDPSTTPARRFGESWASRYARFVDYPARIRRTPGDVFHVLDHSHANLALAPAAERAVLTCHDIIPLLAARGILDMPTGRFTRYTFPMRLSAMRRCAKIIAISESTKRDLVEHGGIDADKIVVVYYGRNPNFTPEPPDGVSRADERKAVLARYGIPDDARVILHVGTATRYKNTPALFHALRLLRDDPALGENVWLLRIGAEFFPDEAELMHELHLEDRVAHAGRIFDDRVLSAHYRAADVFGFPSLHEGFGLPPMEAMACATPVVTSNVASLPEVVGDAGITVAPRDHEGFARALRGVLMDKERRLAMGQRCLEHARRFNWERCASETLAVYNQVIKEDMRS